MINKHFVENAQMMSPALNAINK